MIQPPTDSLRCDSLRCRPIITALLVGLMMLIPLAMTPARAQDEPTPITEHPGFVNLGAGSVFDADRLKVHVSIKDAMLRLVAAASRENEPELAKMMEGLRAVEVRVFEVTEDSATTVGATIRETANRLKKRGWDPAVEIRMEDKQGFLYFRFEDERTVGLAGMFVETGGEAMFVNIVGDIDPTLVGKLAARFNISVLGEVLP